MRPSWIEVDLAAIRHNVSTVADLVAPRRVTAVVKADGYGHGAVEVAAAALDGGADRLAVALIEEGVVLRNAGFEVPILLLSEPPPEDIGDLVRNRITPSVQRSEFVTRIDSGLDVEIVVDSGMHRVGADPGEAVALARQIDEHPHARLTGIWSHFAVAEADADTSAVQAALFEEVVAQIRGLGIDPGETHLANTAGALYLDEPADRIRLGLGLYGLYPDPGRRPVALRPAMRVVSHVTQARRYPAGTRVSYGLRRPLADDAWVATVPIGYADGVPRRLSESGGGVLIGGEFRPFAGTVTMDQVMVDCGTRRPAIGEEVVLIGSQGGSTVGADDWAARTDTISYEIVAGMGSRLPRRYR